jgi:hypothetical protein
MYKLILQFMSNGRKIMSDGSHNTKDGTKMVMIAGQQIRAHCHSSLTDYSQFIISTMTEYNKEKQNRSDKIKKDQLVDEINQNHPEKELHDDIVDENQHDSTQEEGNRDNPEENEGNKERERTSERDKGQ